MISANRVSVFLCLLGVSFALPVMADRLRLAWPTPNHAYANGEPLEAYIQPTVSGRVESGLYGCVRNDGHRFHEAIDLFPIERDQRGEATDEIYAIYGGIVRYVNAKPGNSSYGRYIVIEHHTAALPVMTLYAHLASIGEGIAPGVSVRTAQCIGIMGRSAGARPLPKDRTHLHFEIGLRLTDDFQPWYDWKKFGSANDHGVWNGMNLVGVDPLAFYNAFRAREVDNFLDYWRQRPVAVTVRWATSQVPDFVQRYPALRTAPLPLVGLAGWEITFDRYGVPLSWQPLVADDVADYRDREIRIVSTDDTELAQTTSKSLVRRSRGKLTPGKDLLMNLQLLTGQR